METEQAKRAARISADAADKQRTIREDAAMSESGKRDHLVQLHERTRLALRDLRLEEDRALSTRRTQLEAKVFAGLNRTGNPADVIAFRDAQDRAATLTKAADALRLLALAEQSGDHGLAEAVARRAVDMASPVNDWDSVFQAWIEPRQHLVTYVDELGAIDAYTANPMRSMAFSFATPQEVKTAPPSASRESGGSLIRM